MFRVKKEKLMALDQEEKIQKSKLFMDLFKASQSEAQSHKASMAKTLLVQQSREKPNFINTLITQGINKFKIESTTNRNTAEVLELSKCLH